MTYKLQIFQNQAAKARHTDQFIIPAMQILIQEFSANALNNNHQGYLMKVVSIYAKQDSHVSKK